MNVDDLLARLREDIERKQADRQKSVAKRAKLKATGTAERKAQRLAAKQEYKRTGDREKYIDTVREIEGTYNPEKPKLKKEKEKEK